MRTLEKNKINIWYVSPSGFTDEVDDDGYYTGAKIPTYSTPTKVRMHLYPSGSEVVEQIFGKDASLDMVAVSNNVVLDRHTLMFLTEPTVGVDYSLVHDFTIDIIAKSLNTYNYGLKRRV
jgi:hypothetical protein